MEYGPDYELSINSGNMKDIFCYFQYLMEYRPDYEPSINAGNTKDILLFPVFDGWSMDLTMNSVSTLVT